MVSTMNCCREPGWARRNALLVGDFMFAISVKTLLLFVTFQLELLVRDARLQVNHAQDEASKLTNFGCVGYIGSWGSGPTIAVANLLSRKSINRAMMGFCAASPKLSEISNYVRTNPMVETKLVVKLMKGLSLARSF